MNFNIRPITENDVDGVINLYKICYGESYPYQDFYKPHWIKKGIYNDSMYWLIAEEVETKIIHGSGAVLLDAGDHDDLMGEFGRLVVNPNIQKSGIGIALVSKLDEEAARRIEFGFGEARTIHWGSQKIIERLGFVPMGFQPMKYNLKYRESMALYGKLYGIAKQIRKKSVLIIPEIQPLAELIADQIDLEIDFHVDQYIGRYPSRENFHLQVIDEYSMPYLLRIEIGRIHSHEIFGSIHLNYGFFKINHSNTQYLVAWDANSEKIQGAIGYKHDYIDDKVKIIELVAHNDFVKGYLIDAIDAYILSSLHAQYIEVDVSAYSPRIQKTFYKLGYRPVAYCPAMVFRDVERLDAIRFVKIPTKYDLKTLNLTEKCKKVFNLVNQQFC